MPLLFGLISAIYVALIFFLAGLPGKLHLIQRFNPLSLAHIPIYGLLTFFLIRTFVPEGKESLIHSSNTALILSSFIALCVAVLDEIHQIYIPNRDASVTDVLLDGVGIGTIVLVYIRKRKNKD